MPQPVRSTATAGPGAGAGRSTRGQSVLFSNDPRVTQAHKETVTTLLVQISRLRTSLKPVLAIQVNYCGAGEQDLLCINERQVMVRSKAMYDTEPPNTSLEGVQSDLLKR
jgi:hypothetical protein